MNPEDFLKMGAAIAINALLLFGVYTLRKRKLLMIPVAIVACIALYFLVIMLYFATFGEYQM